MEGRRSEALDVRGRLDPSIVEDLEDQGAGGDGERGRQSRTPLKFRVVLQAGNSSAAQDWKVQGIAGAISPGGCEAIFPVPLGVGDIYRLEFEEGDLEISLVFARCHHCRLIHEDAFEAGFSFFTPVRLREGGRPGGPGRDLIGNTP